MRGSRALFRRWFLFRLGTIFGRVECWYSLFGQNCRGVDALLAVARKEEIHVPLHIDQENNSEKHSCKTLWLFLLPNIYRTAGERESIFFNMIKTFKGAGFKISIIHWTLSIYLYTCDL